MLEPTIVPVPEDRFEDLKPLWRALYDHQTGLSPHLRDREVPFERAWESRRDLEREWFGAEPQSFVLAAQDGGARYVGYAFVRIRSGEGFAVSWSASRPLAELITLVVMPEARGREVGSKLLDAVDARLRELGVEDMVIGVVATNTEAIRLYERRGAVPFLTQFLHRVRASDDAKPATEAPTARADAGTRRDTLQAVSDPTVSDPVLTGGCLCGGVRFELTALPPAAGYCHCTRCQRRTGTGSSLQARIDGRTLRLLRSKELVKAWRHPDGGFEKLFCRECGGHLFSRNPDDHTQMSVRMGAFDADPGVRPSWRAYVAYAAPWEPVPDDGLERFDEGKPYS